jgi:hypothetical protein
MTEFNGVESEEARIIANTKTVLKLMMQNGRYSSQAVNTHYCADEGQQQL